MAYFSLPLATPGRSRGAAVGQAYDNSVKNAGFAGDTL